MHDSEQEHRGITGCRVTYESTIFYNEANKFSIIVVKTSDPRIPPQACNGRYYGDRMLRFTAVGYELPRTKAVELELDGEWVENKYGYQLQVEQWQEIVPQTADGLLAYLGSGLIKGIGPKTAEDIVATFGPDTLNILDNSPEKLLQIRGITEGKLKDIEESYAESRVLRNLMSLLGPFKITPATALKIYQHFGPACVDILKKCPYDLCQISGFGFKRVDGIVRKTDNRLHSTERIKGAVLYTLEDARSKSGHLFLPAEDLTKETLLLLNAPIPIPEQRVRTEEVQETLQQMILHGAVVAYKQYLYSPRVFGQEDDTARMIAERLAYISVAENIESSLESVRESLGMKLKKDRGRFTVRFDMENPDHVCAVEYLERQRDRGKAQYLADAILCYEKAETKSFPQTDRAWIEQIVQEYLEKQSMGHTPNLQKEEPSISSPPIDLIASALADFRG